MEPVSYLLGIYVLILWAWFLWAWYHDKGFSTLVKKLKYRTEIRVIVYVVIIYIISSRKLSQRPVSLSFRLCIRQSHGFFAHPMAHPDNLRLGCVRFEVIRSCGMVFIHLFLCLPRLQRPCTSASRMCLMQWSPSCRWPCPYNLSLASRILFCQTHARYLGCAGEVAVAVSTVSKLYKKSYRLDIRKHFFSQRNVDHWNKLIFLITGRRSKCSYRF